MVKLHLCLCKYILLPFGGIAMKWGFFSLTHLFTLVLAAGITVALYYLLKKRSAKVQTLVLGILSLSGIFAIVYNLVKWGSPVEYLPLHLCSLNAMVLPFAVFSRNKTLNNLLLLWSFGAILAVVVNNAQADWSIFSTTFAIYYFPHVLEFAIPVLMFKLKLTEKDVRCAKWTIIITMGAYTLIHLGNLCINHLLAQHNVLDWAGNLVQVNYMYSLTPENPVLQLFYNILPLPYWYMYLAVPIIAIYLGLLYIPQIKLLIKGKSAVS